MSKASVAPSVPEPRSPSPRGLHTALAGLAGPAQLGEASGVGSMEAIPADGAFAGKIGIKGPSSQAGSVSTGGSAASSSSATSASSGSSGSSNASMASVKSSMSVFSEADYAIPQPRSEAAVAAQLVETLRGHRVRYRVIVEQAELQLIGAPQNCPEGHECKQLVVQPDAHEMARQAQPAPLIDGSPFQRSTAPRQLLVPCELGDSSEGVVGSMLKALGHMGAHVWRVVDTVGCQLWAAVPSRSGFAVLLYISVYTFDGVQAAQATGLPQEELTRYGHILAFEHERTYAPGPSGDFYRVIGELAAELKAL